MAANLTLPFQTLRWEGGVHGRFFVLDQRKLPGRREEWQLDTVADVFAAIQTLAVRGAPAIGAAAAYGLVVGARNGKTASEVQACLKETAEKLAASRPTAYNLFWAIDRMLASVPADAQDGETLLAGLLNEAQAIEKEDAQACLTMGQAALALLPEPIRAMTHCNAGALATCGIGTALSPFYVAHAEGRPVTVIARETRPLLQGARLTAWELAQAGIPVTLIADSAAAHAMSLDKVNCVVVGADRIAASGDAANKIGTYGLAISARRHGIPFYVIAPASTFDTTIASGEAIVIESRSADEIIRFPGESPTAPTDIDCFNPAFDVTPASLIDAIVTERGVIKPVNADTVKAVLAEG